MTIHGYELTGEWKNSTFGKIAPAQKGGKRYFIKKYQSPVAPIHNGTFDTKTFDFNKKRFEDFVAKRTKANTGLRSLAGSNGNIVVPVDEFVDDNHFAEVYELIVGAISKDEIVGVLSSMSIEEKLFLMQTVAGALYCIHSKSFVHRDLNLETLLLVKDYKDNYFVKLHCSDIMFSVDAETEEILETIDYCSPELGAYIYAEDDKEEKEEYITEKTDIFSLGLIYHFYLVGAFPETTHLSDKLQKRKAKGKAIYPWAALNSGGELIISSKIENTKLVSLITDMLCVDYRKRPSALDVLKRLREIS